MPRFDGDPIFNALLDTSDKGSEFAIEIEDFSHAQQWYEPNTAVLRTQLVDHRGQAVEITDFAPRFFERSRYFRPVMLVRRLRPIHGAPRVRVGLNPRFDWGRIEPTITQGSDYLRFVGPVQTLRLTTDAPLPYLLSRQPFVLTREHDFFLGADEFLDGGVADTARLYILAATAAWGRCGLATRRKSIFSMMCMAMWCSEHPRLFMTTACCTALARLSLHSLKRWVSRPCAATTSPTLACGSCAPALAYTHHQP